MADNVVGIDCKLYRNTGTYASPTWSEIPLTRDLTLKRSAGKADSTARDATYDELLAQAQDGGELSWSTEEGSTNSEKRVGIMLALIAASRDYQFA